MAGLGIIAFILFMAVSIVQIYAGFIGIEYHLGVIWAYASIAGGDCIENHVAAYGRNVLWRYGCLGMGMVLGSTSRSARTFVYCSCNHYLRNELDGKSEP